MKRDYAINLAPRLLSYYARLEEEQPGRWSAELALARRYAAFVQDAMDPPELSSLLQAVEEQAALGGTALLEMREGLRVLAAATKA